MSCSLQLGTPISFYTAILVRSNDVVVTINRVDVNSSRADLYDIRNITLMHVGKTGGNTLRTSVLRVPCEAMSNPPWPSCCENINESVLSKLTTGVTHVKKVYPKDAIVNAKAFLFPLRDPVSRFVSAYAFQSPNKCRDGTTDCTIGIPNSRFAVDFYFHCFPTLNHLVGALDAPLTFQPVNPAKVSSTRCLNLLQSIFVESGYSNKDYSSDECHHFYGDYRYYASLIKPSLLNRTILAIRTEYLWTDISALDIQLGGDGNFSAVESHRYTHGSEKFTVDKNFNYSSEVNPLCCALWQDIPAYRQIVENAVNLREEHREELYRDTFRRCGVSSWRELYHSCLQTTWSYSFWYPFFSGS